MDGPAPKMMEMRQNLLEIRQIKFRAFILMHQVQFTVPQIIAVFHDQIRESAVHTGGNEAVADFFEILLRYLILVTALTEQV